MRGVVYRDDAQSFRGCGAGRAEDRASRRRQCKPTGIPELGFPGGAFSAGEDESWWDAVIGARVVHPLSSQWSLVGYADVGGGESDLTYQASLGAIWSLNERFTVKGGYRYLSWDYEDGGTVWDMEVSGPYLGLGIAF